MSHGPVNCRRQLMDSYFLLMKMNRKNGSTSVTSFDLCVCVTFLALPDIFLFMCVFKLYEKSREVTRALICAASLTKILYIAIV